MMVRWLWLIVGACVACLMLTGTVRAQSNYKVEVRQVDQSDFPKIKVYVAVYDEAGQYVQNLGRDQFGLKENGQSVEIIAFKGSGSVPITTLLTLDHSGSMQGGKISAAKAAATAFVDAMSDEDRAAFIIFDDQINIVQPFTNDKNALRRAINAVQPNSGTAWYDAAWTSLDEINKQTGRRSVIFLTDGMDNREEMMGWLSFLGHGSRHTFDELASHAGGQAVPAYVIGLGNRGSSSEDGVDEPRLQKLAEVTHGRYYFMPKADELRALYSDLSAGFHKEYEITFMSANPNNTGTWRDIAVTVGTASGGATGTGSSAYLEAHVLNLKSSILVALILLIPLLAALIVPMARDRRREAAATKASEGTSGRPVAPTPVPAPIPPAPDEGVRRAPAFCSKCGNGLRPNARFCGKCGAQIVLRQ